MTTDMIKFDLPKNQSSIIKVLGVGGGGSNAVNHMFRQGIEGVDFFVCNTDSQALEMSPVPNKMQLGVNLTEGRGAGNKPEVGRDAAIEDIERIQDILSKNTKMLFITAGMGGGTGTGAAPIIAKTAKEMGILTVGIVTIPFTFEGRKRHQQAEEGLAEMKDCVDTLLIICNDKLRELYGNLSVSEAFGKADNVLTTAAKGIAEIITLTGNINVDFADVKTVMSNSGVAIMGSGSAEGEDRAIKAVQTALASPLLNDNQIRGAKNILLNITSGTDEALMDEISEITDYIQDQAGSTAEIIWGLGTDVSLGKKINITLVATGFGQNTTIGAELERSKTTRKVMVLDEKASAVKPPEPEIIKQEVDGMKLFTRGEKQSKPEAEEQPQTTFTPHRHVLNVNDDIPEDVTAHLAENASGNTQEVNLFTKKFENNIMRANPVSEAQVQQKIMDREQRLRELSMKMRNPEGLNDLEKQPAFVRRNVLLNKVPSSAETLVSRYTLQEDEEKKVQIKSNNSFLHDNVD